MSDDQILTFAQETLYDLKALKILVLDVRGKTSMTDYMVIAEGTSIRHVKSIADNLMQKSKANNIEIFGCEGMRQGDWVLVDLGSVIIHIMLPEVREYYQLEKLWLVDENDST